MCLVLAIKILCACVASLGALFAWYIWKSNKTVNSLIDSVEFLKKRLDQNSEEALAVSLLLQGLYNVHPKGGKLRKEDIDFIKKVLDKKTNYMLKLNPMKDDNSLKN